MTSEIKKCVKCGDEASFGDYCLDHWPGYNLCADPRCEHYRCEHGDDECGSAECPCTGFKEGSKKRVLTQKAWKELRQSWGSD